MTTETLFTNLAISLAASREIEEVARPLKEHFGVTSLVYGKNYNDGSEIRLTNQPAWVRHYYKNSLYLNSGFEQHPKKLQSGYAIWSQLSHHQTVLKAARDFNIDHGMTFIQKTDDGCEFYFIGTTSDKPQVTNLLLNHLTFLHRFTYYFKEQAAHLIDKANKNRITVAEKFNTVFSEEQGLPYKNNSLNLQKILSFKKTYLNNDISLSARELVCANLLTQGKSARLIAETLFLSPRTVETHLSRLKEKLHCRSKAELISRINELKLYDIN